MVEARTAEREIVVSRVFDAPREVVWEAFTDPEQVVHWWGPNGFTNTTHEMDVRPGGVWRHMMHGPDGRDHPNRCTYIEVVRHERLVYDLREDVPDGPEHILGTVTFEERDGGTEVTLRMVFPNAEEREKAARFGAIEGGQQTLGRLAEYLRQKAA